MKEKKSNEKSKEESNERCAGKRNFIFVILLTLMLLFISGQESGCPQQGTQTKSGIEFSLVPGVNMLGEGKILEKDETFIVGVFIQNYNSRDQEGIICVRDNIADSFAGIPSENDGDCQSFFTKASQIIGQQGSQTQNPGTDTLYFPQQGQYQYKGLPLLEKPFDAKLYVTMKYRQVSQITAGITSPDNDQPTVTQEAQPIQVSVKKSVYGSGENYNINLEITLTKTPDATTTIYSSDFTEKNKIYFDAQLSSLILQCTSQGKPISGLIDFENEKIIKCSALSSSSNSVTYPLIISLDYGVVSEKQVNYAIKTKEI